MNDLDYNLRLALRRQPPSPDFTERVLLGVRAKPSAPRLRLAPRMVPNNRAVAAAIAAMAACVAMLIWVQGSHRAKIVASLNPPTLQGSGGAIKDEKVTAENPGEPAASVPTHDPAQSTAPKRHLRPGEISAKQARARELAEGARAKAELMLAMQITGSTLNEVDQKVKGIYWGNPSRKMNAPTQPK
jgi:hypothetical protein